MHNDSYTPPPKRNGPIIDRASDIALLAVDWIWRFWLAIGKLHLLVGEPGSGKTTLLADLLVAFSTGGLLPDGTRAPKVFCLYWTSEDSIQETVMGRLIAAGADLENVLVLRGMAEHGKKRYFRPSDMPELVSEIKRLRADGIDVRVIAIDPLPSGSGNTNNNDAVRKYLEPLILLAEQEGLAIIGVRHLAKASSKKKLADRINGSVAYLAVSRVVLFVSKIAGTGTSRDNPVRGVLVRAKSNLGPTDGGHAFTIVPVHLEAENGIADATALKWDAQDLVGDPEAIVRAAESNAAAVEDEFIAELEFVGDLLRGGPVQANEAISSGQAQGYTPENLRKALAELGGKSMKEPGYSRGAWYWVLPGADFDNLHDRLHDGHNEDRRDRSDRHRHELRYERRRDESDHPRNRYQRRGSRDEGRYDDDIPEVEKGGKVEKHDQDEKSGDSTQFWAGERNLPDTGDSNPAESAHFWQDEMNLSDQNSTRGMFEGYMRKGEFRS
ncbi:AAA domain-containing protein [Burkholderia sp. WP9]|uniref:AAA family ATPase n=1 Tax=Burkholderia sp. WP9 TaxID=1500263 RepID=UPI00089B1D98|nr:AAA family ATPase [Burkholderia sp. WP9]SED37375.1 AAA domain-containing protein [Burkholderia sp. WP9]